MRIGQLSRRSRISVRSLRHYETQGLLSPERDGNGYRRYRDADVDRVCEIRDLLDAGFTTREIRWFLPCLEATDEAEDCPAGVERHLAKLRELDAYIDRLQQRRNQVLSRLERLGMATGDTRIKEIDSHVEPAAGHYAGPRYIHGGRR